MMRALSIVLFVHVIICITFTGNAQSLSPTVISTSGGFYSNSSVQLSFTAGEMTMVETFTKPSNILTQGFQQPYDFGVSVTRHENLQFSFSLFPNPGNGNFKIALELKTAARGQATIYDVLGKKVWEQQWTLDTGSQIIPLTLSDYSDGMYLLEFVTTDNLSGSMERTFEKIQLIK